MNIVFKTEQHLCYEIQIEQLRGRVREARESGESDNSLPLTLSAQESLFSVKKKGSSLPCACRNIWVRLLNVSEPLSEGTPQVS